MDIGGYLLIARRWWWTLLVATAVSALIAYLVASRIPPTYEAGAQLLVGPINTDVDTLRASSQLAQTYAQLAISQPLLESTAKEFGGAIKPSDLAENVRASASDVTRILNIKVDDSDPQRAAQLANTLANELIQLTSGSTSRPEGQLQLIGGAQPPTSPVAPQVSLIVLLAAMAGLLGALVLVILVETLSDAVREPGEIARLVGAPILGTIEVPSAAGQPGPPLVEAAPGSPPAIALRQLTAKLLDTDSADRPVRIAIVGVGEADAAIVAANVAAAASLSGYRSILVDGSDGGAVSHLLGVDRLPGLRELVRNESNAGGALTSSRSSTAIMPSGAGPLDGLGRERARAIIDQLGAGRDAVVVDGGGVTTSPVALDWIAGASLVVLVVALGAHPSRSAVRLAGESVAVVGARLAGVAVLQGRVPQVSGPRPRPRFDSTAGYRSTASPESGSSAAGRVTFAREPIASPEPPGPSSRRTRRTAQARRLTE
ncbi:MAG TPA: Wzz/FepE/Etk N-terminal domain-containing protein [Candidatus Limnocylindrales bacterium]|nr:Wzz/FepE/Etk N-terminal domain-containing protein [Candidatus Limnocylindrales bacterium]